MTKELGSKVRPLPPDSIGDMQQKADELISALNGAFHAYAIRTLTEMDGLMAPPRYEDEVWRARLNALAHDLKGLGGTFGYDLMTIVAGSMGQAISDRGATTEDGLHRRLTALAKALDAIVRCNLKGDGGAQGRDLLATLQLSVQNGRA